MLVASFRDCESVLRDPAFLTDIMAHRRQVYLLSPKEGMCSASY